MTQRSFSILILLAMALLGSGACSRSGAHDPGGKTPAARSEQAPPANPAGELPRPAQGGERFVPPDPDWPEPEKAADATFKKREGAHFENFFETWQVSGFLTDANGQDMDFTVLFYKTGPVMMLLRHGFASLNGPKGYRYVSFAPGNVRGAAENELKEQLQLDPDNQDLIERLERLQSGQSPEFVLIGDEARVLRNSLAINYGAYTLNRVDEENFVWRLTADVQGDALDLELRSSRDPVQFYQPYIKMGPGGSLDGYVFPHTVIKGTITSGDTVRDVLGTAMMTHVWGKVDAAGFMRYAIMGMNFENGLFLQTFRFYSPDGVLVDEHTVIQEPLQAPRLIEDFILEETGHWESPVSGIEYPSEWIAEGAGFHGVIALDDTTHEMSVAEGRGAFYVGPCSYRGEIPGAEGMQAGRGFCRLVAPQP